MRCFIWTYFRRSLAPVASCALRQELKAARNLAASVLRKCPGGGETTGSGWERYSAQSLVILVRSRSSSAEHQRGGSWRGHQRCCSRQHTCPCPVRSDRSCVPECSLTRDTAPRNQRGARSACSY